MTVPAIMIAAAAPRAGATTVTIGVARALAGRGHPTATLKSGPDVYDAVLHGAALQQPCFNLDSWALRLETIVGLLGDVSQDASLAIVDGHGGFSDRDAKGSGTADDLAAFLDLPVVLVVDARDGDDELADMLNRLLQHEGRAEIVGVFLNRVRDDEHARTLVRACDDRFSTPIVGHLRDDPMFAINEHHWATAAALFTEPIDDAICEIEAAIDDTGDFDRLVRLARRPTIEGLVAAARPLAAIGQRIAVAQDSAFALAPEATLIGWQRQGAQIFPFSPLSDEPPPPHADAVYLPGGPVAGNLERLAANREFLKGLARSVERGAFIFGEGTGYAVLGEFAQDEFQETHAMAGLLPVRTTLSLVPQGAGYRRLLMADRSPLGPARSEVRGWAAGELTEEVGRARPLARSFAATGDGLGPVGARLGNVAGSPVRLLDRHPHLAVVRN